MPDFCIICEFNPLHGGHKFLIDQARKMGADNVVCVMSGNATQRGELAVTDKYLRAEAAVKCGADLVLELPYPWCAASADFFATAAVSIAVFVGDVLLFGSECGDVDLLTRAAKVCESAEFAEKYAQKTESGQGAATAYAELLREYGFDELSSNDILGIAYIRAIDRLGVELVPKTVKRRGSAYNDTCAREGQYPSATAVRQLIARGELDKLDALLPEPMLEIIKREYEHGRLTDLKEAESAILGYLRLCPVENMTNVAENEGGLSNRIISAAKSSATVEQMFDALSTKRYTDAKLRRAVLFALTSVRAGALRALPQYTLLLGASGKGREILAKNRKTQSIRIITKPADAPKDSEQYELTERLDSLYGLARREKLTSDAMLKKKAYISQK